MAKLPSLRKLPIRERIARVLREADVTPDEWEAVSDHHPPLELANHWIENAIGYFSLPLGIAEHFVIDGISRRIPLAVEETSIIAALSSAAKWVNEQGTLTTEISGSEGIGQIQFPRVPQAERARKIILDREPELIARANEQVAGLVSRGGGFRRAEVRILPRPDAPDTPMLVVHLYCDTCDAMGANLINQACEIVSDALETWIDAPVGLRILSNLVDSRLLRARIKLEGIDSALAQKIEEASRFAELDPYRASTHNKGIMNGVDGVLIATGNDWRAVEAGAHAYAARAGSYRPLSIWRSPREGVLEGVLEMPLSVGTVGGVTRSHPVAGVCLKISGVETAADLSRVAAAVGLTQNLAALRALCSDGIVAGHMRLHLSNLVLASDASEAEKPELLVQLDSRLRTQRRISAHDVREVLGGLRRSVAT